MIQIQGVSKKYEGLVAVKDLSLDIKEGEIFAFLGPNGAGKTTTVKLLAGLLFPDAGAMRVAGWDVVANPQEVKKAIGLVPDEPHVYPKLTAMEFLELVAGIYGLNGVWTRQAEEYLALFDMAHVLKTKSLLEGFSHGMKQKVIWAGLLMRRPKVWLLDEPLVGLDPKSIRTVKELIKKAAKEGATIFISTHVLSIAEELADRVGIIQAGELQFVGTKKELENYLKGKNLKLESGESLEDLFLKATLKES